MEKDSTNLRQKVIFVLQQNGEPMSYRALTDEIWRVYPDHHTHMLSLGESEKKTRADQRVRLGLLVKGSPGVFTATMSDGIVQVGLAATDEDEADDVVENEESLQSDGDDNKAAVYWYTFPAYKRSDGLYPIKIGRGKDPLTRVAQQVTAMPEKPEILGTYESTDPQILERALHSVLTLRGKKKKDAPGTEWFVTSPIEIEKLIKTFFE